MVDVAGLGAFFIYSFMMIFFIVDPLGNLPLYMALTNDCTSKEKKEIIRTTVLTAFFVLCTFAIVGKYIFEFFGFTLPAFRIAGGILLFVIAMQQMFAERKKTTDEEHAEALDREAIAIVPLGVPIYSGPGSITAVMILMSEASASGELVIAKSLLIILAIGVTQLISLITLMYSEYIFKRLGKIGAFALARIMGLILAAISVQFIITGIAEAIHNFQAGQI
ncbi:MAG: MarC family protein [Thermoplasmata archaeon]